MKIDLTSGERFPNFTEKTHPMGSGIQRIYVFENGYRASVVRTPYSYGGAAGLWEFAVLAGEGDKKHVCYATPITNDVLGYLTDAARDEALDQVAALPRWAGCSCVDERKAAREELKRLERKLDSG